MRTMRVLFTVLLMGSVALQAAELTATNAVRKLKPDDMADGNARSGGQTGTGQADTILRVYQPSATLIYSGMLVFVLPDLGGESIASANLTLYGKPNLPNTTYNSGVDLYGVRYAAETGSSSDTEITTSDSELSNAFSVSGNNGTGIMDGMFPASTSAALEGTYETSATADVALGAWIQAQYNAGAQPGDYIFLRLTADTYSAGAVFSRGWVINSADATNNLPELTITTTTGALPPTALFSANPTAGYTPLTVTFTDGSVGTITNRFWDFGDGTTTNTTLTTLQHTYTSAGTSTVQLVVSGPDGVNTNTQTDVIVVTVAVAPDAVFSAAPVSGYAPLAVTFTDTSTGDITNRFWDFGDGNTTNTAGTSMVHTYAAGGTYGVELVVSGPAGISTNTQGNLITVTDIPDGMFVLESDSADCSIGVLTNGTLSLLNSSAAELNMGDDNYDYGKADQCGVLVFKLPDLGGKAIAGAGLTVDWKASNIGPGIDPLPKGIDLYGVRFSTNSLVTTNDFGFRAAGTSNGILLQNDFLYIDVSEAMQYESAATDAAGDANLVAWITAQYSAGAVAGDYIFIRLHADSYSAAPFYVASGNSTVQKKPTLILMTGDTGAVAPPPSTVSLDARGSGQDVIRWTTAAGSGYVYSVWYSTNLLDGFHPLQTNLDDTVQSITNSVAVPAIFYKVEAE